MGVADELKKLGQSGDEFGQIFEESLDLEMPEQDVGADVDYVNLTKNLINAGVKNLAPLREAFDAPKATRMLKEEKDKLGQEIQEIYKSQDINKIDKDLRKLLSDRNLSFSNSIDGQEFSLRQAESLKRDFSKFIAMEMKKADRTYLQMYGKQVNSQMLDAENELHNKLAAGGGEDAVVDYVQNVKDIMETNPAMAKRAFTGATRAYYLGKLQRAHNTDNYEEIKRLLKETKKVKIDTGEEKTAQQALTKSEYATWLKRAEVGTSPTAIASRDFKAFDKSIVSGSTLTLRDELKSPLGKKAAIFLFNATQGDKQALDKAYMWLHKEFSKTQDDDTIKYLLGLKAKMDKFSKTFKGDPARFIMNNQTKVGQTLSPDDIRDFGGGVGYTLDRLDNAAAGLLDAIKKQQYSNIDAVMEQIEQQHKGESAAFKIEVINRMKSKPGAKSKESRAERGLLELAFDDRLARTANLTVVAQNIDKINSLELDIDDIKDEVWGFDTENAGVTDAMKTAYLLEAQLQADKILKQTEGDVVTTKERKKKTAEILRDNMKKVSKGFKDAGGSDEGILGWLFGASLGKDDSKIQIHRNEIEMLALSQGITTEQGYDNLNSWGYEDNGGNSVLASNKNLHTSVVAFLDSSGQDVFSQARRAASPFSGARFSHFVELSPDGSGYHLFVMDKDLGTTIQVRDSSGRPYFASKRDIIRKGKDAWGLPKKKRQTAAFGIRG